MRGLRRTVAVVARAIKAMRRRDVAKRLAAEGAQILAGSVLPFRSMEVHCVKHFMPNLFAIYRGAKRRPVPPSPSGGRSSARVHS
jgi:hypothetical protein